MYVSSLIIGRAIKEIAPKVSEIIIFKVIEVYTQAIDISSLTLRIEFLIEKARKAEKLEEWELIVWMIPYACDVMYINLKRGILQPRKIIPGPDVINFDKNDRNVVNPEETKFSGNLFETKIKNNSQRYSESPSHDDDHDLDDDNSF